MGASESTGRSTGTEEEEEQRRRQQAATALTIVAGAAAAAWGISKLLSNNTDSDENDHDDMAIKADHHGIIERSLPNPSIRSGSGFPPPSDRFRINAEAQSGRYVGISQEQPSMWLPPPRGRFKMNTDGACKPNPGGPIGYGGILRNDHGDFVFCFYEFIGDKTDCVRAELHGIHKGLKLLEKFHLKGSILETDSQAAFDWINNPKSRPGRSKVICECWNMITECIELVRRNKIDFKQIDGEDANRCADKLAAMAIKKKKIYTETKYVPLEIKDLVDKDKSQIGLPGCG